MTSGVNHESTVYLARLLEIIIIIHIKINPMLTDCIIHVFKNITKHLLRLQKRFFQELMLGTWE